jgi:hypothetical protein
MIDRAPGTAAAFDDARSSRAKHHIRVIPPFEFDDLAMPAAMRRCDMTRASQS